LVTADYAIFAKLYLFTKNSTGMTNSNLKFKTLKIQVAMCGAVCADDRRFENGL